MLAGIRSKPKACGIVPSALSKVEADIQGLQCLTLFQIARNLGVPCDYLLDDDLPYPYEPGSEVDAQGSSERTRVLVTWEEKAFLEALRNSTKRAREVARMLPTASLVTLALVHRVAMAGKGCRDFEKLKKLLAAEGSEKDCSGLDRA